MPEEQAVSTKRFYVKQGVQQDFLRSTLIKDITTLESIYDLIDNSIDAARNVVFNRPDCELDKYGLPVSYSGYRVSLRFAGDSITLCDNASGIPSHVLREKTFITGILSNHRFGIGRFGVGLKRSLFRLGTNYALITDTSDFCAKLNFSENELGATEAKELAAEEIQTKGRSKTLVRISGLRENVRFEINSSPWKETVLKSLSRRYGRYIKKGLQVFVNGKKVPPFGPGIRQNGPVKMQESRIETREGVNIYVEAGMHELYRLTSEPDYEELKAKISSITDEYGWYFVCNDRIIKVASHESDLGWSVKWHPEYYGFVGWVHFVSKDPAPLPWDTKKTQIDHTSAVFRQIAGDLQQYAENYKTENKRHKTSRKGGKTEPPKTPGKGGKKKKGDHNENWDKLLPEMEIGPVSKKVKALAYEAQLLEVSKCYSGSMLLRSIVELSLLDLLRKTNNYTSVCQVIFDEQAAVDRPFTDEQKAGFRPPLREMLRWLSNNPETFPTHSRRECKKSLDKFIKHLRELNGVVHEGDLTSSEKLKIVRNDSMALLEFLLEQEI